PTTTVQRCSIASRSGCGPRRGRTQNSGPAGIRWDRCSVSYAKIYGTCGAGSSGGSHGWCRSISADALQLLPVGPVTLTMAPLRSDPPSLDLGSTPNAAASLDADRRSRSPTIYVWRSIDPNTFRPPAVGGEASCPAPRCLGAAPGPSVD